MPFFPSLPDDAGVRHILGLNPAAGRALIEFHSAALRNASKLQARDKELIAAYVSGLNACQYCYGVHAETAKAFGVEPQLIEQLLLDPAATGVDERLQPLLAYAYKLTLEPFRMTQTDADAVFAAGWGEAKGNAALYAARGQALRDEGYAPLLAMLPAAGGIGSAGS